MAKKNASRNSKNTGSSKGKGAAKGSNKTSSNKASAKKGGGSVRNSPFQQAFWKTHKWEALILLLIPFILYGSTATFDYVLDDKIVLTQNNFVKQGFDGVSDIFKTESFTGYLGQQQDLVVGARYRPLSIATFAMEYEIYGENPAASHLLNVLLYALCGLLLFRTLFLLVPNKKDEPWFRGVSFAAALLFILHPVHSEAVANIKGRDEILAVLFSIATFYYIFRYIIEKKMLSMVLACVCFFLGILAKENTLTFLGVIPLAMVLFTKVPVKRYLNVMGPLVGVTVLYLIIRVDVIGYLLSSGNEVTALMNNPFVESTGSEKFATITYTMGRYLGLSFFPHPLTHDYYPYHIPIMNWGDWQVLLSLVLNLGLIAFGIWQWKKNRVLTFCIGFYFLTISITSNILFPVGTFMNERFLFMPSVGVCFALAYLLFRKLPQLVRSPSAGTIGLALTAVFALGFTVKTFMRVPAWENEHTLNAAAIEVSVNSARANQYYAYSLYEQYVEDRDRPAEMGGPNPENQRALLTEALPYVNRALEIHPTYHDAITCKGGIHGGFYALDRDINACLEGFYPLVTNEKQNYYLDLEEKGGNVDNFPIKYLNYLNRLGRNLNELIAFYHRVGFEYWWQQKQNARQARRFINMGLSLVNNHPQLIADLTAINNAGQ